MKGLRKSLPTWFVVRVFHSESSNVTNFDLVPSFILEMGASETTRNELRSGRIPDHTKLKGGQNWQMLFDKGAAIQVLKWSDLKNWPVKTFYDLKFSRMALTALSKDTPGGCFIAITQPLFFKRAFAVRTVVKPGRGRSRRRGSRP